MRLQTDLRPLLLEQRLDADILRATMNLLNQSVPSRRRAIARSTAPGLGIEIDEGKFMAPNPARLNTISDPTTARRQRGGLVMLS